MINKGKVVIIVATHKEYNFPNDDIYMPLHVGKYGKEDLGYVGDDTGDNISTKNQNYCELTGMYWAYKNLNCDYIGLMHYRRYLKKDQKNNEDNLDKIVLNKEEILTLMEKYDVILPEKSGNVQKSVYEAYKKMHHIKDLDNVREIISNIYSDYLEAFDKVVNGNELCLCNMFIMSKENYDNYCEWLFNILFNLEKITDISNYSNYQKRIYGFIGERLFNVWLEKNKYLKKYYLPVHETEPLTRFEKYKVLIKNKFGIRS